MRVSDENVASSWGRRFLFFGWCLTMLVVAVLALLPVAYLQLPVFSWWDKAQHALAFTVLTAWSLWLWPTAPWRVVMGMLVFGALIELLQWATGWRFGEWADLAADAVGVLLAWVLIQMASHGLARPVGVQH